MGGVSPETCWASYKYEINFDTLLDLVGFFYVKTRIIKHTIIRFSLQRYNWVIQYSPTRLIEFKTIHPVILLTAVLQPRLYYSWYGNGCQKVCRVSVNSFQTNIYNMQRMRRVRVNERFSISLWQWLKNCLELW